MSDRRWLDNPLDISEMYPFLIHELSNLKHGAACIADTVEGTEPDVERARTVAALVQERLAGLIASAREERRRLSEAEGMGMGEDALAAAEKEFLSEGERHGIFGRLRELEHRPVTADSALRLAVFWKAFTEEMPGFLVAGAAKLPNNAMRFALIQGAWEELGSGYSENIHSDLFDDVVRIVADGRPISESLKEEARATALKLQGLIREAKTPAGVVGQVLGIEIPGIQIIETLIAGLSWNPEIAERLNAHLFFRIHRRVEQGHIRKAVASHLRFCKTETERAESRAGVKAALDYWEYFWGTAMGDRAGEGDACING